jgi:amino acid transporter
MIGGRRPIHGRKPADRRVRVERPHSPYFRYTGPDTLVAREAASVPRTSLGRTFARTRAILFGRPISLHEELSERLNVFVGLAVFASDNISSSAYATEEIMRVLVFAGAGALALTMPITVGIVIVLAIVVTSYQQTVAAYPHGGGSYIVAKDNLGTKPGLVAAAALLTDYVLTVAVSIAAGVAALTSFVPELFDWRVHIGIVLVIAIAMVNLRGIRESGALFSIPTYVYLVSIFGLLAFGLFRSVTGTMPEYHAPAAWLGSGAAEPLSILLILRAFSSGSVALTGTEAVSNGVPAFKPPEPRNAQRVLILMGLCFGSIFLGMSFLASQLGILPDPNEQETVISQLTRTFVGVGPYYFLVQVSTAILLVLAANTAFADFPRLSSILARDGFLPRICQFRGDRLAFSYGIIVLAAIASLLIWYFEGSVTNLIPLYTVGVFVAFTLSQSGMVRRWRRLRNEVPGWRRRAVINGIGAITTGIVAIEVAAAKLALGAWIVLILVPLLVAMMLFIARQYRSASVALTIRPDALIPRGRREERVVVPVPGINRAVVRAINVARSIAPDVRAVLVSDDPLEAASIRKQWERQLADIPLVFVESPYRALVGPLLAYLDVLDQAWPPDKEAAVTFVIVPEYVARSWWERILYNQSARRLRTALLGRRHTVVVNVPYRRDDPDETIPPAPAAV